jgi:hypothetical protein
MKIFNANTKFIFVEILAFLFFCALLFLFDNRNSVFLIIVLLTLLIVYLYKNSKIIEISISENKIFITEWRFVKTIKEYEISNLDVTYEEEMVGRSVKQKVLRIYNHNSLIAKLKPSFSGWNDESIEAIYTSFDRKFD